MLYHLAINTDVFEATTITNQPEREIQIVEMLKDMCIFGTVANLHDGQWVVQIGEQMNVCSQRFKTKVQNCLKTLNKRKRLIKHPRWLSGDPASHADWLRVALDAHQQQAFDAIVLDQPLLQTCGHTDSALLTIANVLDSPLWVNRPQSFMVQKCEADYRKHLAPVLRHARTLALVDPYMNPRQDIYLKTIELCSDIAAQYRQHAPFVEFAIHAGQAKDRNRNYIPLPLLCQEWQNFLQPLAQRYHQSFHVYIWETRQGGERFHNRYILTDQCGISSNDSLECVTRNPSTVDWSLLDEHAHMKRLESVKQPTAWYQLLRDITVS